MPFSPLLKAIKEGEIYIGYDSGFVFGEVNADRMTWVCKTDDDEKSVYVSGLGKRYERSVGFQISTKAVGNRSRNDVTREYKHLEMSVMERNAWNTARVHTVQYDTKKI